VQFYEVVPFAQGCVLIQLRRSGTYLTMMYVENFFTDKSVEN